MEGEKTQSVPYYQQPPLTGAALEVMHDGEEKRLFDERSTHKKRTDCYFTNVSHSSVSSKSSQQRKSPVVKNTRERVICLCPPDKNMIFSFILEMLPNGLCRKN